MLQAVNDSGAQEFVWEGIIPFGQIEIAGDDGGVPFVTFADKIMEVFVLWGMKRFEAKVVNDKEIDAGEGF